MRRRWLWLLAALVLLGWLAAQQVSYVTYVGTAGATVELTRAGETVPASLFSGVPVPEGGATLLASGEVWLGSFAHFAMPDGSEIRCVLRLGRIACDDGWTMRFTDGR